MEDVGHCNIEAKPWASSSHLLVEGQVGGFSWSDTLLVECSKLILEPVSSKGLSCRDNNGEYYSGMERYETHHVPLS